LDLKYVIDNESFVVCPLLPTNRFIKFLEERCVKTSEKQLERFEELGLFFPVARVRYPVIRSKVEYLEDGTHYRDLGVLGDDEEWAGDVREEYGGFLFTKEYAEAWMQEGLLWEPSAQPFEEWKTFTDENGKKRVESYYSSFQCHPLNSLINNFSRRVGAERWVTITEEETRERNRRVSEWAQKTVSRYQRNGIRGTPLAELCQVLSNRYFPSTQTDRRTLRLLHSGAYHDWDWHEYSRGWDSRQVLDDLGLSVDELQRLHGVIKLDAKDNDPLAKWYELVSFVSVEEKRRLKGGALLAQTFYSMEHMLRLFYEDLTGERLPLPDESLGFTADRLYGEGVGQNELEYLELLANKYHLNPRPRLLLVLEGVGEEEQFPRLLEGLFGVRLPQVGIGVLNIGGIGNFMGDKKRDKRGALERFIDDHHARQTFVFVVLDNEDRAEQVKQRLVNRRSIHYPRRTVTKDEYVHLWERSAEFDNFSHEEIARAMTELCDGKYAFDPEEVAACERRFGGGGDPLSKLYREKLEYGMPKPELLKILCDSILANTDAEFDEEGKPKRPVVRVLQRVYELARMNHQAMTRDIQRWNQGSGFLGRMLPYPEQFAGSLIGQCLGDALGFVVEGCSPEECREYVGEFLKKGRAGERARAPFIFGQYSDDSQLARELLQSYKECDGKFEPARYAERIEAIFAEGRIVGPGRSTEEASRRLAEGVPWDEAGTPPPAAGNGSAMRAGPAGLLFFDNPEQMIEAAKDQGRITHQDPRCSAGAVAVAGAVALAATSERIDPAQFLSELAEWVKRVDEPTAVSIGQLMGWVGLRREGAAEFITGLGRTDEESGGEERGIAPFVTSSVLWSLYSFLMSPDDYWETICTAISVGGDVDTTAAMAGAMSGAYLGVDGLPKNLARRVTDRGEWGFDELIELARGCHKLAVP
jgi:ADP-ribosylglycohydrolase